MTVRRVYETMQNNNLKHACFFFQISYKPLLKTFKYNRTGDETEFYRDVHV